MFDHFNTDGHNNTRIQEKCYIHMPKKPDIYFCLRLANFKPALLDSQ